MLQESERIILAIDLNADRENWIDRCTIECHAIVVKQMEMFGEDPKEVLSDDNAIIGIKNRCISCIRSAITTTAITTTEGAIEICDTGPPLTQQITDFSNSIAPEVLKRVRGAIGDC
jgi:hypothetical protein